jgi:hypothetical protein
MRQPGDGLARVSSGALQAVARAGLVAGADTVNWVGPGVTSPDGANTVFSANTSGGNAFINVQGGKVSLTGDITNHQITVDGLKITWIDPNWSGPFAMNSNQQFVAMVNAGNITSLVRVDLTGATSQIVARLQWPSPAGPAYTWINPAAIDAAGNVVFLASLADGSSGLFLWKNGQVQKLVRTGELGLQGNAPVSGISNIFQFAGSKVAALVWYQNAGAILQIFDGTKWTPLIAQGQPLASGRSIDGLTGAVAASDNGDISYTASSRGYASLLVHTHDGRDLVVADATEPLPDGSWPIEFYGFNMTPQGSLIFAVESYGNGKSHLTLFSATPMP